MAPDNDRWLNKNANYGENVVLVEIMRYFSIENIGCW